MQTPNILIVEDEIVTRTTLKSLFEAEGYNVFEAENGQEMHEFFENNNINLVIMDINLPGKNGLILAREVRDRKSVGLIFLTGRDNDVDRILGLEIGADDYLTKPFDSEVLLAKIKAILNRKNFFNVPESDVYEFEIGKFKFNSKLRFLTYGGEESVKLSPKENQLLRLLVLHVNDLLPRELALNKIWRDDSYFTSRSMDVYIAKLRKYLKTDAKVEILNIHGEGFRLVVGQ